ncbi:MAG: ATP-binding cassette domain-containing protein [Anaerolineae bacterium]|nr:ATP-binding cassette domain-containing protein [Anaerolineae bacterium]
MDSILSEQILPSQGSYAIEVKNLRKSYGKLEVLKGINLHVERGTLLAMLGPNGAGKTTTIRILSTLLRPDSGTARVFGHDVLHEPDAVRRRVSLTGQFASIDDDLTGVENLVLVARLLGYSWAQARVRASELLEAFDLVEAADRLVKNYSGGMRRRLDIAASIVVAPDVLFLDEPTTGLDPRSRRQVWDIIRALRAAGATILLTTQYLEEADQLADRVIIIDHGTVIADGTIGELKRSVGAGSVHIRLHDPAQRPQAEQIVSETLGVSAHLESDPSALSATTSDPEKVANSLSALARAGIVVTNFSLGQPSLDEVFLALTGQPVASDESVREQEIA